MTWQYPVVYDVIVVGGGHAGCEAAYAAAKMGASTLLLTMNPSTIGQMSCNPSIGGIAKGHIVREVDALGGLMGKAADHTAIQFRMLNTSRGPAVHSPRAQIDKEAYKRWMKDTLETTEHLHIQQGMCTALTVIDGKITGVTTQEGTTLLAKAVVLTTGTFLQGLIHIGDQHFSGGRGGEPASNDLSNSLRSLGIQLGRLKTGTPVRIHKDSIDYALTQEHPGDDNVFFSYDEPIARLPQISCHMVHTNSDTKKIIQDNLHRSPLYGGKIQGVGPRYCPSIEDKIVRFSDKESHQVFLEPEGHGSSEVYTSGLSSSLPVDVQYAIIHSIPALRNAHIMRWAYAIEYDYVTSGQMDYALQSTKVPGLFFAGQINGTTGYEEAAGQGIMAGINAVLHTRQEEPCIFTRDQSYIGVMIDDLVSKGIDEPYRMFTSRAEHRLLLRHDNADRRLRPIGRKLGLITEEQYQRLLYKEATIASQVAYFSSTYASYENKPASLRQILARPELSYLTLTNLFPELVTDFGHDINAQIEIAIKYEGYICRQEEEVLKLAHIESIAIPSSIDFATISGLRTEAKLRLSKVRPQNLGQASRIPGIAPSDICVLMIAFKHLSSP